jgi:hypothetical protein
MIDISGCKGHRGIDGINGNSCSLNGGDASHPSHGERGGTAHLRFSRTANK